MTTTLKPYPAYKDSGVPWLGKVPEHWEVRSLGSLTSPISERGQPDLPLLSVVREKGVIPRTSMSDDENHNFVPDDLSSYKVVRKGNLVINKMKAWQGSLGIASMDGIVSPAYFVFDFRIGDLRFGQALLRSKTYVVFFAQESDGVRIGQWDLSIHGMKRIPVVVPPLPEQTAIVRFLDYMDRRIRRSIRTKQKLIKLLEEYRQALIHQAVTGKIDVRTGKPYPAYKDSGVPWLGKVPEHWEVVKLKFISKRMQNGSTPPTDVGEYYADQGIPWYGPSSLLEEILIGLPVRFVTERAILDNKVRVIQPPALVISVIGNVGKSALMLELGATNQQLTCCELDQKICNPVFVVNQFRMAEHYLVASASSTTIAILDSEVLRNMPLAIPPLPEQTAIVEYLDAQTAKLDAAIAAARREIELLREYRERLIADVVTGKVDVRQVAAQLPDEPPDQEAGTEEEEPVADELATVDSQEESNGEE
jgi:type I restriction enzyme S subunit